MRRFGVVALAAFVFMFSACGGDDEGPGGGFGPGGKNNVGFGGGCLAYDGDGAPQYCIEVPVSWDGVMRASCEQGDGQTERWHSGGCPRAGAVGYCVADGPLYPTASYFYSNRDTQKEFCEEFGSAWHDL